jgi:NAD(P)H-flavin reductase
MESEWLQDAMRYALEAPIYPTFIDDEIGSPPDEDPRYGKVVNGVLYSRRLILTYQIVVWGVIIIISATRWIRKALRARRKRASMLRVLEADGAYDGSALKTTPTGELRGHQDIDGASSSSSTLQGTLSPPVKDADEQTPLLHQDQKLHARKSIILYIKAFLVYQPPPIPIFNKTLPSNGTSIVLLAFTGLNVFYTLFHINFTTLELFVVADRCGLIFVANLPLLYIVAAKNQPLQFLTGHSYEFLNIFHRRLGELLILQITLHAVGMIVVWYTVLGPWGLTLGQFLSGIDVSRGLTALTAYQLIHLTSLASFRQRAYELFLASHVALQAIGLLFVFLHNSGSRIYVGIALAIFLIDRLVCRICVKTTTVEATATVMEDDETVKLSTEILQLPQGNISKLAGKSVKHGWKAADHVFVTVPSLGRKYVFQAHPLVIASTAPAPEADHAQLDFLVRVKEGFSSELLNKARNHDQLKVRLDGPYGSSHSRNMLEDSDLTILVAGGSGIAVAWPLVNHLLDISRSSDTAIAPTFTLRSQKIVLIWIVHKSSHISWIGHPVLSDAESNGVEVILPDATEDNGRPDLESMIDDLVKKYGKGKKTGIVASGPDSLTRGVRNICSALVWRGKDVSVTMEKFGW